MFLSILINDKTKKEFFEYMINRTLIRIKAIQVLYAYYQNSGKNIDTAEKEFLFSLSKSYELYNYMLWLMVSVTRYAVDDVAHKEKMNMVGHLEQEISHRFIENQFAAQLEINNTLKEYVETNNVSWSNEIAYIKRLYNDITQSTYYQDYMNKETVKYDDDRELWRGIYKNIIMKDERIDDILEEKSLYWNDDRSIIDTFVLKTIKKFEQKNGANQELIPEYKDSEDISFATKLYRSTIFNADEYRSLISKYLRNWDLGRLAYMDVIIMQAAIAEFLTFPNIPTSVTINEYVEIAKWYSTPKSSSYINGILDTVAKKLREEKRIIKQ